MTTEHITSREAAVLLLAWLEARGAICRIDDQGFLRVDLNPVRCIKDYETAERISMSVLALREEIKTILLTERVTH